MTLDSTINKMTERIAGILDNNAPSIYLYGSAALGDFRPGWSDIDILVLTEREISVEAAGRLVNLRQKMLEEDPDNPYYRQFEGGMLSLEAFLSHEKSRVVYWGTSGERITDGYSFDAFCMSELLNSGVLLHGRDVRELMMRPTYDELKQNVRRHYETIRNYAKVTGRSLYSYGWLLDISRCIYTLRTGKIIAKTAAGEWASVEKLCPCAEILAKAVEIRKNPLKYKDDVGIYDVAETLGDSVQKYADILKAELNR